MEEYIINQAFIRQKNLGLKALTIGEFYRRLFSRLIV